MNLAGLFKRRKKPIQPGEEAPEFSLPNAEGKPVSLSPYRGKQAVVLYFYPKDDTPVCTAESVLFRDKYEEFKAAGAEVLGVSSDSPASHIKFAEKFKLPFPLLSDSDNKVRELYRVPPTLKMTPGRTTFVIDREGVVRHEFTSQFNVNSHVVLALEKLQGLRGE